MKPLIFSIIIIISISLNINAQCPNKISKWVELIEDEYPGENLQKVGATKIKTIVYNLYSDKFFISIFKKPFDEVNTKKLDLIASIATDPSCVRTLPGRKWEVTSPARDAVGKSRNYYNKAFSYELIKAKVIELRQIRKENKVLLSDVNSDNPQIAFNSLIDWKVKINNNYAALLLPSELTYLNTIISKKEHEIADKELNLKLENIIKADDNYATLQTLISFKKDNQQLYPYASQENQSHIENETTIKINRILNNILSEDIKKSNTKFNQVNQVNEFYKSFSNKFKALSDYKQIKDVKAKIIEAKINILFADKEKIKNEIKASVKLNELSNIENLYLSHLDSVTVNEVEDLRMQLVNKKIEIKEQQKREDLAQQERLINQQIQEIQQHKLAEERKLARYGFSFNTSLVNETLIKNIFKGDFDKLSIYRDDQYFIALISSYMYAKSKKCESSLPSNKVPIYDIECVEKTTQRNGWGEVVNEYCSKYEYRPQEGYTSPELFEAFKAINDIKFNERGKDAIKVLIKLHTTGLDKVPDQGLSVNTLKSDMYNLFDLNPCNNTALQRFEENLIRFAHNQPPLQIDGTVKEHNINYNRNYDFKSFINHLIDENSKNWAVNQYIKNSVSNVRITKAEDLNTPLYIIANYKFSGYLGTQNSWVKLTFNNGFPDCLYFKDYPNTCRTADRTIVKNFINGQYISY
ncbi:hypothetical protein [Winogradskyella psychrotolerans]|uniref:hypothetical protein n=1 Tax=Winogradskyella psychrotolerans TaxID=1344585 RepID=UPI001C06F4AA|nr:hypothetical protein [Winogradskyella psychrotolerans]MBU2929629.1 hypothetical protein [Winogradskyella psychrotolerans]